MRKYLLIILSFVFQYFALSADNYTYCYWVDDNHAAAKTTTLTTNKLNVTMDVSSLSPGMHTLFVRAKKNNGGWTSPRASHFFKMLNPVTVKTYYWFDDNESSRFEVAKVNGETFMIDVSHLSDGTHTLHVRMEGEGATSTTVSSQFLKYTGNFDAYYWFDDETERREFTNAGGSAMLIDVSHLKDGLHSFNAMLVSDNGTPSMPVSRTFIKMPQPTTNDSTTLKFWIDGAEYSQHKVAYGNEVVDFELDVDTLGVGMHYLQVQAVTNSGSMSNIASGYFMRMPGKNNEGVMAYRYWVNDDNANSTFTMVENTTLPYEFIGDLDVAPQPLRCARFHFEVNDNQPMLYAVNDVTVQFFSVGGQLINAKKEFIESIAADTLTADEWTVVRRDTVIKANTPKDETIYWYTMNLEEGDTVGVKTNYSSTLQVYSHSGKKVFESKTDSSLVLRKFIAEKNETYYLALHTVNTTKTQVTLTIDINEFMRYYNVDVTATAGGIVTGGKLYLEGTEATITATPNEGYHFVKWSDGVTETTRTFTVVSDSTFVAEFDINVYNVTLSAVNGTVIGAGEYEHGTEITISATPAEGYHFVCWSDGVTDASRSIIVTDNVTLSAEFAINVYTVTLSAQNGTVTGSGNYNHGTSISINATPVAGYHFVRWSDGDTNATRSIVVTSNVTLTAEFAINVYTVDVTAVNGSIIGDGEYQHGATATLTAVAAEGYHFVRWSDGVTDDTRSIVVTSNITLTAEFAINVYNVTLSAVNGTVTGAGEYQHGTTANITATPAEGYHFVKWSDGDTNATRAIVVTEDVTLTAEFAINVYNVTLSAVNGTVTGAGEYQHGATATITAVAAEGYHFVKWSDGVTETTRSFVMTSDVTLTAEFAINVYTISATAVNGTVTGAGEYQHGQTVTLTAVANPNCHFLGWSDGVMDLTRTFVATKDASFSAYFASDKYLVVLSAENGTVTGAGEYEHGTTINISATPAEGYHFVKWSDGDTNATRSIVVTSNVTLTAEFAINVYTVDVTAVNGSIIGDGEYQHGATATLTAVATTGYHFVRWSDGVTDATRSIVVTANVTLTAEFAINIYNVTLSAVNGTVTGTGEYQHGATANITATPAEGYHFVKWSDGDTNATRAIVVTEDVTLTAEFAINVYNVTLSAVNGTVTGAGEYQHGATATITAVAAEGYHFVKWSDGITETTRSFVMTSDVTLTAEFAINVYTISATAVNGTVTGAGEYQHGQTVTLTAVANPNCHFLGWSDGVMDLTRTFVATKDASFSAYFASDKYLVVLSAENGTVTGAGEYEHGTTINISATPAEGYHFVKWSDGNTNATRSIVVTSNVTLTAEFAINIYTVNVTTVNGTIIGTGEYQHGTTATLTAVATTGYHFVRWSDGVTDATRSIVVKSNVTLTAEFAINVYTVTLTAQNGTVTGSGNYNHGTTANITATPAEGYHFVKWSDGVTDATRSIIVTDNVTLTAEFAINVYNVTLSTVNGTVTGAGEYEHGATATITATPAEGYHFVKWSDGNTDATRAIVVTSNINLTAEFAINVYQIEATAVNGTVTGAGEYQHGQTVTLTAVANPNCHFLGWSDGVMDLTRTFVATKDASFSAYFASDKYLVVLSAVNGTVTGAGEYQHGTTANITATPAEGYHFVKWSDGDTNATRAIVVTEDVTLTAEFAINVYNVTLSAVNGTVTGAGEYQHGATATITAVAAEGYHFVKWSDGVTETTRSFVMTSDVTLTAEFAINVYTISATAVNGTVTGAGEYQHGQTVTLTAVATTGYHFVRWSDGVTDATRSIVVTANVTLTAEFAINIYNVTLSAVNGTVTGTGEYQHGATANITATPAEGYHFVKWSDGDTNATRAIVVTEDVTLTAEFAINVYNVTLSAVNGTVTGAGEYEHGATATIIATPAEGYHFVKWSDGNTDATRSIVVTSNINLTAEFAINVYKIEATAVNGTVTGAGEYEHGTEVTLAATPAEGYHFVKWSDGNTNATRAIVVTENVSFTAEFAINVYNVTLSAVNGSVTGAGEYNHGATATITAIAAEGYHFVRWSDGNTEATRAIMVTNNITLTAEFAINVYTIAVTAVNGTVTGAGEYQHGATIVLTAIANTGYRFVRWSDGVTESTRTFVAKENMNLTAEFTTDSYNVVLTTNDIMGRVIGSGTYAYGTTITIVAIPNAHYHFVKWSDGDTNDVRTIIVTEDVTLSAEFAANMYELTLIADENAGRVIGAGTYNYGTEVTIVAIANSGYKFSQWSDGDKNDVRTITISDNITLTAEFAAINVDVENIEENSIIAYSQNQTLYIEGIEGNYYLLDITGKIIYYGDSHVVTLPCGVYIISTGEMYQKVIIRK